MLPTMKVSVKKLRFVWNTTRSSTFTYFVFSFVSSFPKMQVLCIWLNTSALTVVILTWYDQLWCRSHCPRSILGFRVSYKYNTIETEPSTSEFSLHGEFIFFYFCFHSTMKWTTLRNFVRILYHFWKKKSATQSHVCHPLIFNLPDLGYAH